jgi:hypothetical protein
VNGAEDSLRWSLEDPYPDCDVCDVDETAGILTLENAQEGSFFVLAVSVGDPSKRGRARVTVVSGQPAVQSVEVAPGMATVPIGGGFSFEAAVEGAAANPAVTWTVSGGSSKDTGFSGGSGALSVGEDESFPVLTVTARSLTDPRVSGQAVVRVPAVEEVAVVPGAASVARGSQRQFHAALSGFALGAPEQAVKWTVEDEDENPVNSSQIDRDGLLSVAADEAEETLVVRAVSAYDGRKSGTATVTVRDTRATLGYVEPSVTNGTTDKLTIFFDRDIPGLTANDIGIDAGTGAATKGTGLVKVPGTSGVYELGVASVSKRGTVTVRAPAEKNGIIIENTAVPAVVLRPAAFQKVEAVASSGLTAKLRLQFDADIDDFALANVGVSGTATKGSTLTRTGTGVYELAVSPSKYGTATVTVAKTAAGVLFSPETLSVTVLGAPNSSSTSIKTKFGITTAASKASVEETFKALHLYIQGGGLSASGNIVKTGDYIDLENGLSVENYNSYGSFTAANSTLSGHGTLLRLLVVGINSFNGINSNNTPHVVFHFQNIPVKRRMEASDTNQNGYLNSEMRKYLVPTGTNGSGVFLTGLINAGVPADVLWSPSRRIAATGTSTSVHTVQDKVWLPTEWELFGTRKHSNAVETSANQARFSYYSTDASRIKYMSDNSTMWHRTASPKGTTTNTNETSESFVHVNHDGTSVFTLANSPAIGGVAPAFCVQ